MEKIVFFDIDYTLFDTATFKESGLTNHVLYKEVVEVLEQLSKVATLGIFSEGDTVFQHNKILQTNLQRFFSKENMFINSKKEDILKKLVEYSNFKLFLVDDKLSILAKVKAIIPTAVVIWVKRGPFAKNQEPIAGFNPDNIISDLKDLVSIVEKN